MHARRSIGRGARWNSRWPVVLTATLCTRTEGQNMQLLTVPLLRLDH